MTRVRMRKLPRTALPPAPKLPPLGSAPGEPEDKLTRLRRLLTAEDWGPALRLAKCLPGLGDDGVTLARAWEAWTRPGFAEQLGRDPQALIETGKAVLRRRYGGKKP